MAAKVMTRGLLRKLADSIYNPNTGDYKVLTMGALYDSDEKTFCAIGELHSACTGAKSIRSDTKLTETAIVSAALKPYRGTKDYARIYATLRRSDNVNDSIKYDDVARAKAVAAHFRKVAAMLPPLKPAPKKAMKPVKPAKAATTKSKAAKKAPAKAKPKGIPYDDVMPTIRTMLAQTTQTAPVTQVTLLEETKKNA